MINKYNSYVMTASAVSGLQSCATHEGKKRPRVE